MEMAEKLNIYWLQKGMTDVHIPIISNREWKTEL